MQLAIPFIFFKTKRKGGVGGWIIYIMITLMFIFSSQFIISYSALPTYNKNECDVVSCIVELQNRSGVLSAGAHGVHSKWCQITRTEHSGVCPAGLYDCTSIVPTVGVCVTSSALCALQVKNSSQSFTSTSQHVQKSYTKLCAHHEEYPEIAIIAD
jgi:hypothetical protein